MSERETLLEMHIEELEKENAELRKHLVLIMDGSWTYVHGWCTIQTVFKHWRDAWDFMGTPKVALGRYERVS